MDKNAIKKYAVWARRELIEKVSQKALQYGIEEGKVLDSKLDSINGVLLSDIEKKQRQALIRKINESGYTQVIEEVAYTWFNRFIAIRFMEVNGYLPSHVRVFTNEEGEFHPQIMSEALHLDIDGLNKDIVYELKNANKDDELFKYLLITQCNALSEIFPKMFQKIADYTELLLPDYLLRDGSVIEQMVNQKDGIPETDWQDQVQIIGWLYQYYNTEPKDKVFSDLKKNVKITKENVPAATQLFTPDWIVHYMVENSLGRLWVEGHPNEQLKAGWKYYVDEAVQEVDAQKKLEEIRKEYIGLKPEEIRCIDPCMGSGHILCVIFDTLVNIYEDYGYSARDAAASIVENNIWGLDIDERAAQLSYFAIMMKARQYDRRFFTRNIQPHVYVIEESNGITADHIRDMGGNLEKGEYEDALKQVTRLVDEMNDAKEYGSLTHVSACDWDLLRCFAIAQGVEQGQMRLDVNGEIEASHRLQALINIGETLSQKYMVVVTNPPYMAITNAAAKLYEYARKNYPDSKADMFAIFIERCHEMTIKNGFLAMITQHAWMFLSSFEKLREKLLRYSITNMAHLGPRAFEEIGGEVVQTTSFVMRHCLIPNYLGTYARLVEPSTQQGKERLFLEKNAIYYMNQEQFEQVPGQPYAYWVSPNFIANFAKTRLIGETRKGMVTADNPRFIRTWMEVDYRKIGYDMESREEAKNSKMKWFPYIKGGEYRKWYGNLDWVVNWENDGQELLNMKNEGYKVGSTNHNLPYIFKPAVCWTKISSSFAARIVEKGYLIDDASPFISIADERNRLICLGLYNTPISQEYLDLLNPTMNFSPGTISNIPYLDCGDEAERIEAIVEDCIAKEKDDWDSFETSSNFKRHPLVKDTNRISTAYDNWSIECSNRFNQVKQNEEELNRIFLDIYGLQDELDAEVDEKNVTIRKADKKRDIQSFISYAVGCMFGRYSLDVPGIVVAGGELDFTKYNTYKPDEDSIIPICDDEYFEDDIVGRFIEFVKKVYGEDTLEENLQYIADVLGGTGTAREIIRNYFLNDFYADHLRTYQKRPIYWLFDSGKKNGFKCLIYMHRYQADTIARIRTDYVHEQQARYRTAIEETEKRIESASGSDKVKLTKKLNTLKAQDEEIHTYEEKIHHLADQMISINLDDGVKNNYEIFKDVLAKIK